MMTIRISQFMAAMALVAAVGMFGTAVQAGPITGDYSSTDLGGTVDVGRWTEGFSTGLPNTVGNGAHAESWDGALGGQQWELTGLTISSTTILNSTLVGGSGTVIYLRVFDTTNGQLILSDNGPWWNVGDSGTEYVVNLTSYVQVLTVTYASGTIANASSIETFSGTFDGYAGYELLYGHTLGAYLDAGLVCPSDYPSFEPGTSIGGAWGVAEGIRFTIVPEPATMGLLGLGLMGVFVRRKKVR